MDDEGYEDDEEEDFLGLFMYHFFHILYLLTPSGDFIDDEEPSEDRPRSSAVPFNPPQHDNDALEDVLSRIHDKLLSRQPPGPATTTTHELISRLPCAQDFPLWRIRFRVRFSDHSFLKLGSS